MLTNLPAGLSSFGIPVLGGGIPTTFGKVVFVDATYGSDGNSGESTEEAVKSLTQANSMLRTNRNDVAVFDTNAVYDLATMETISKNRIHFIGLDGGGRITGQRMRVQLSTAGNLLAVAATLKVTGVGVTLRNIKLMNSGTHDSSVTTFVDEGEACVYQNCSFMKFTDLDQATVSDLEVRGDSNCYLNCEFGFDTLTQSAARPTMRVKANGSKRFTHNRFFGCIFTCQSSSADKQHILVDGTDAVLFESIFFDCTFIAAINQTGSAVALTNAVASVAGLVEGNLLFVRPNTTCTNFCAGVTDNIKIVAPAVSSNANEGVAPA